jgi:hypothetical protein
MKPSCQNCKHYFITYDKQTPRGCHIYGIKSQQLPCLVIKMATGGNDCLGFEMKDRLKPEASKNLNDPKLW